MTVPRPAIEAAARASYERIENDPWEGANPKDQAVYLDDAKAALTAAEPHWRVPDRVVRYQYRPPASDFEWARIQSALAHAERTDSLVPRWAATALRDEVDRLALRLEEARRGQGRGEHPNL